MNSKAGQLKSPFWQNKYTKDGCEGKKPSHTRKTVFGKEITALDEFWHSPIQINKK
jgi:hypothetical protein